MPTSMLKKSLFFLLCCGLAGSLSAQGAKKLQKLGDDAFAKGAYTQAADLYNQAWQKGKKPEAAFKAGEAHYLNRDYRKAAEAYINVKDKNDQFPLVGLKYARSLKQDGQYDKAAKAFSDFRDNYTGEGKAVVEDIVQTEMQGCELGKLLPAQANQAIEVSHAGSGVNTTDNDFAPLPISDKLLYYSSTNGGIARIFRSNYADNAWGKGATPESFPVISKGQYCHGSISADGQRYYFTICDSKGSFENRTTRCEIYVIKKQASGWSNPEMLNESVNAKDVTSTHPQVVTTGDKEVLYFASNRAGGRGGMDIWYVTRSLAAGTNTFSNPVNLGPSINTLGDEMTPFYSKEEGTLYFSSNGMPGIGGFDIFSSKGEMTTWGTADNMGLPFNSSVDDYYFIKSTGSDAGFLVSNRIVAGEKITTKDDDIFAFKSKLVVAKLEGEVFAQETGEALNKYVLYLYEIRPDGSESVLLNREFTDKKYSLELLPNRKFRVEITPPGYETGTYMFTTDNPNQVQGQPLMVKKLDTTPQPPIVDNTPKPNPGNTNPNLPSNPNPPQAPKVDPNGTMVGRDPVNNTPPASGDMYTTRGIGPADKEEYMTNAPRFEGEYYKIQLAAVTGFKPSDSRFESFVDLGNVQTESMTNSKKMTRILIASFYTKEDAKAALAAARKRGFPQAFIVRYTNGERYGKVNF
jgi:hypothetical protein